MYRRVLNAVFVAVLFLIASPRATAQGGKFFVDASLGYVFDNHEFDASGGAILPSQTFHFVRVSPEIGWRFSPEGGWNSRLVLGVDLVKQAGTKIETLSGTLADVPFYYLTSYETERGHFVGAAGSFPRTFVTGSYSELLISEETAQSDFNLDGMYLGYRKDNFFNEIALDWLAGEGIFAGSVSRSSWRGVGGFPPCSISDGRGVSTITPAATIPREWWTTITSISTLFSSCLMVLRSTS